MSKSSGLIFASLLATSAAAWTHTAVVTRATHRRRPNPARAARSPFCLVTEDDVEAAVEKAEAAWAEALEARKLADKLSGEAETLAEEVGRAEHPLTLLSRLVLTYSPRGPSRPLARPPILPPNTSVARWSWLRGRSAHRVRAGVIKGSRADRVARELHEIQPVHAHRGSECGQLRPGGSADPLGR
eukprot:1063602-Prymnesium_polylepis.1